MTGGGKLHWEQVHEAKEPEQASWWQAVPTRSLSLIEASGVTHSDPIIDVGAGASTLVDQLIAAGYRNLTVLDIAGAALKQVRDRLGEHAQAIRFVQADVTTWRAPEDYALWHDRAVFHFLTDPHDRQAYKATLAGALRPGGQAIIATFGPDGPENCSGLDVQRYSAATLRSELGDMFELLESVDDVHRTPWGAAQPFVSCRFRRTNL
ncbi:MAG: class I SAM-dependent methyltransferase [Gemmatimonadota bacterium]|nr:MAG: class I SAM-dependent methyltransferase [Gemmatimonadota bacterium]